MIFCGGFSLHYANVGGICLLFVIKFSLFFLPSRTVYSFLFHLDVRERVSLGDINYMKQILDVYRNDGVQFVYIPLLVRGSD